MEQPELTLRADPPKLASLLPPSEKADLVLLCDIEPDKNRKDYILDLNIIFKHIYIENEDGKRSPGYIGAGGAHISLTFNECKITNHTHSQNISVNFYQNDTRQRNATVAISPKLSVSNGNVTGTAEAGKLCLAKGTTTQLTSSLTADQSWLSASCQSNEIEWDIRGVNAKSMLRNVWHGNIYLFSSIQTIKNKTDAVLDFFPLDLKVVKDDGSLPSKRSQLLLSAISYMKGLPTLADLRQRTRIHLSLEDAY